MKLFKSKIIFIFILSFFSCGLQKKNKKEIIAEEILTHFELPIKGEKLYLIISNSGCGGCIHEAEVFIKNNLQNPLLHSIFTSFESLKGLKIHLKDVFYHSNVTIDENLKIPSTNLLDVYPVAIFIKDGKIAKVESFLSESNLLEECASFINPKSINYE